MANKRLKRYKDQKEQKSSRDILNYEDLPIEDYGVEIEDNKSVIYKKILRVILILFICSICILLAFNIKNLGPGNVLEFINDKFLGAGRGPGYPVNITGTLVENNNFKVLNKDAVMVTDTSFVALNNTGKEIANRQHSFSDPIMKSDFNKFLIYNLGTDSIQIETESKNIYKGNVDGNIITGAISQSGVYALVTECKGYFGQMTVYSKDNDVKYKYYFSESYITDISLSSDGKHAALAGVCSNNGGIKSVIYIFDFESEKPKCTFEYEDNIMLSINYLSNGNVVSVGDNLTTFINVYKGQKNDFVYDEKSVTCFDTKNDSGIALCLSPISDCKESDIIVFDKDGKQLSNIHTDLKIRSVSFLNDKVLALSSNMLYKYDFKGNKKGEYTVGNDVKRVDMITNNLAYALCINSIDKIELK